MGLEPVLALTQKLHHEDEVFGHQPEKFRGGAVGIASPRRFVRL
ncbi:hypothetical protein OH818_18905 [Jiella pelagia]|uniref:Uncharacterized protein n=2 Tax=Jiella pelagia TaxID=2986949 RepID=A0ABY7BVZ3_9HYPH|nr:hypothetical protein OH818_18905 [Jiella pelagia]